MSYPRFVTKEIMDHVWEIADETFDTNELLRFAAGAAHFELVQTMLENSRVVSNLDRMTAPYVLKEAANHGRIDLVKRLVHDKRINKTAKIDLLYHASGAGHTEIVEYLCTDPETDPSAKDNQALIYAVQQGQVDVVKRLLVDSRVDPSNVLHALNITMKNSDKMCDMIDCLISDPRVNPADPELQTYFNMLDYVVREGRIDLVEKLIADPRVDPSMNDNEALATALEKGSLEIAEMIFVNPRFDISAGIYNVIDVALWCNHTDIAKRILANSRIPESAYNAALQSAASCGNVEIVKLTLADPRTDSTADRNEAVRNAIYHRHSEIVDLLLADSRVASTWKPVDTTP
jgi:hypothetical protein